jgi:hypothetical protein
MMRDGQGRKAKKRQGCGRGAENASRPQGKNSLQEQKRLGNFLSLQICLFDVHALKVER